MEISVRLDRKSERACMAMLWDIPGRFPAALSGAVNDTAKTSQSDMSKAIRERVNIKKKDIDPHLRRTRATPANPSATITLSKTKRIPLAYFGARQTSKGVSYKIDKRGGRKLIPGGFGPNIPRLGRNVFVRVGRQRLPIRKLYGPSAWGVFVKAGLESRTQRNTLSLLEKNLQRRVNFELLKHQRKVA